MTKVYNREDAAFKATLLAPPVDDVLVRLMSPQDRARLMSKALPKDLLAQALKLAKPDRADLVLSGETPVSIKEADIKRAVEAYQASVADAVGKYAYYPADFNYLAHAIGASPVRYADWFHDLGGLHLTPGVTTIFAETGAGKTTMADLVAFNMLEQFNQDSSKILRVKLGESGTDLETFLRFSELAEALPETLPPMIIIDSVRLQTFDMGGASRSLSISNQLFRWLTEIDIFAIGHGISVILVMNPLAGEKDKIEQFRGDVESSVMAVVNLETWNTGKFKHRGEKNARQEATFLIPGEIARNGLPQALVTTGPESGVSSTFTASTSSNTPLRTAYGRTRITKP